MEWLIIVVLIGIILLFLKVKHLQHRIIAIGIVLLILLFYISYSYFSTTYDIDVKSVSGIEKLVKLYYYWFIDLGKNVKSLTTHAVNLDWSPNQTIKNLKEERKIN